MAIGYFPTSRKHEPIIAEPNPPLPYAWPMAALIFAFGVDLAWLANVRFPFAAAIVVVGTIAAAAIQRWIEHRVARDPRCELFVLSPWLAYTAILVVTVLANDLDRGAGIGELAGNLALAVILGGLFMGLPAAGSSFILAGWASAGGPLPPRSRARRAMSWSVWRSAANCCALPNFLALLPAMGHTRTPWTSVGSIIAFLCAALILFATVAQRVLLQPVPQPAPAGQFGYREAPRREESLEVEESERVRLARKELIRGIIALAVAGFVLAMHAFLLFG